MAFLSPLPLRVSHVRCDLQVGVTRGPVLLYCRSRGFCHLFTRGGQREGEEWCRIVNSITVRGGVSENRAPRESSAERLSPKPPRSTATSSVIVDQGGRPGTDQRTRPPGPPAPARRPDGIFRVISIRGRSVITYSKVHVGPPSPRPSFCPRRGD